ncbi:MAG: triose-phosphate isomerase family protein [Candidatus Curtissbacteria bacterium]|nr:triose-phosphate isomerase family protein [Candidatus Curtissbacteria bacterium]
MNENTPLVVANLKANKTWDDIATWLDVVAPKAEDFKGTIILCPSHPFISSAAQKIRANGFKIKLGAQDISKFEQGAYTGEVAASQIKDLCQFAIVGHSERRQNFAESDEVLSQKAQNAQSALVSPIFCVQDKNTPIPQGVEIVAYEPVFAIGTGNADTPQNAKSQAKEIKTKGNFIIIYGGSVSEQNVAGFIQQNLIDGVLVATNSLDPQNFIRLTEAISR